MRLEDIYEKLNHHEPGYVGEFREFSVLIPLVKRGDDITVVYQKRGAKIKRQPGEISFPGGAKEAGETDLACAVRETCEELDIGPEMLHDVHKIADMHTWRGFVIHVFAAEMDSAAVDCFMSNIEVEELFEVSMDWFMEYEPEMHMAQAVPGFSDGFDEGILGFPDGYPWGVLRSEQPMYFFGERIIWGITARITKYFIDIFKG